MRAQEMTRAGENTIKEVIQKEERYISASGKEEGDSRKLLIFWGIHYPYLNGIKDNNRRWLLLPENSKPQIHLRDFYHKLESYKY